MTDDETPKVFDMPHARVTLTPIGPGIEIEVWPKAGQSAYAVVDPTVAVLIARHLVELAASQLTALRIAGDDEDAEEADEEGGAESFPAADAAPVPTVGEPDAADEEDEEEAVADNVVDLFSRRRPSR